jgi:hypothetical protein
MGRGEGIVYAMMGGAGGVDGLVEREWERFGWEVEKRRRGRKGIVRLAFQLPPLRL